MIDATIAGRPSFRLLGPVRGLVRDGAAVEAALASFAPESVGIAVSAEELRSLIEYFGDAAAEPIVPLSTPELGELRGLVRFGEVAVPNPSVLAAVRWARAAAVPVEALDPSDDGSATLFTEHIGYVELVRRTVRENRAVRAPPASTSADDYALAWDRQVGGGRGSRRYVAARNRQFVDGARRIGVGRARVALLVDRERFDSVAAALGARGGPAP